VLEEGMVTPMSLGFMFRGWGIRHSDTIIEPGMARSITQYPRTFEICFFLRMPASAYFLSKENLLEGGKQAKVMIVSRLGRRRKGMEKVNYSYSTVSFF
jgi:hypothetical protein